ncbi:meiosis-specific transcription factor ndt80 [Dissophora globulifera]|nr:meiosis-specific transcription factor ndt80 [Dissophora globulifera]
MGERVLGSAMDTISGYQCQVLTLVLVCGLCSRETNLRPPLSIPVWTVPCVLHHLAPLTRVSSPVRIMANPRTAAPGALGHRYSLPVYPLDSSRPDNDPTSVFHSYMSASEGPIIHHRNSIAGSTLPNTVVRARRAGSLAMVEDGPFFSNTKQFYNLFNMNQTQSYKLRVMARIDRGFFTANKIWTCYRRNYFQVSTAFSILGFDHSQDSEVPCLIELKDSASQSVGSGAGGNSHADIASPRDTTGMIGSLDNLRLNEQGGSGSATSRLAVVNQFSICITSKIASTDKKIDLIQHTPKRDKGPQIVPGLRPVRGGGTLTVAGTSASQSVITFERVQFKTATANNGKRRAAQQFYILMVDLYAHTDDGQVFCVASSQSDSLVVRGRSPGHYVDTPERDMITSPGLGFHSERRLSNISQHSAHPYHSHYSGVHSRSHSISAGAGMSLDVGGLGIGVSEGGPLSPMSPGASGEYSPTGGQQAFYQYPSHQAWADGSSMSSPSSTYDGSAFSSPSSAYPAAHPYHGQHSPQEHPHQSYFAQRQPSFGSITPRLMMGSAGVSPRHPFDNQLEPPIENSYENEDASAAYYQTYGGSAAGHAPSMTLNHGLSGGYSNFALQRAGHPLSGGNEATTGAVSDHSFVKTEVQDSGYFAYSNSFAHPTSHPLSEPGVGPEPTPSSTSASSASSSFGYPVQEMGGADGHPSTIPESGAYEAPYGAPQYGASGVIPPRAHHGKAQGAQRDQTFS